MSSVETIALGVVSGLIVNGLTSLVGSIIGGRGEEAHSALGARQLIEEDADIVSLLRKANAAIAIATASEVPLQTGQLRAFLVSSEAKSVVRHIYASQLVDQSNKSLQAVKSEFTTLLSLHLGIPLSEVAELSDSLFQALLRGCNRVLSLAVNEGVLSAHEARSEFRYRIIRDELEDLKRNLEMIGEYGQPDVERILLFEDAYSREVGTRHGEITPPQFAASQRVPIDDLYVPPNLSDISGVRGTEPRTLDVGRFLSELYRAVILGNPGSGKTTLTHKLCHDLADRSGSTGLPQRQVTPILVVLKEYGAEKKTRNEVTSIGV